MAALADLLVKMDVDSAKFRSELDKMGTELHGFAKTVATASHLVSEVFAAEKIIEGAHALFEWIHAGTEAADKIQKMSQSTGIATEELSRLAYAAQLNHVPIDQLKSGLSRLAKSMSEAQDGTGDQALAFKAMGIAVEDSKGHLKGEQVILGELADKFAGFEDGPAKAALAIAIFGKSGADLIPLLNEGSEGLARLSAESDKLGLTVGGQASKSAVEFNDNLTKLHLVSQGLAVQVSAQLTPMFNHFIESMTESKGATTALSSAAKGLGIFLKSLVTIGVTVYAVFQDIVEVLSGLVSAAIFAFQRDWKHAWESLKGIPKGIVDREMDLAKYYLSIWDDTGTKIEMMSSHTGKKIAAPAFKANKELDAQVKAARKKLNDMIADFGAKTAGLDFTGKTGKLEGDVIKFRLDKGDLAGELATLRKTDSKAADELREKLIAAAYAYDIQRESAEAAAKGVEAHADMMKQGIEIVKDMRTPLEALNAEQARLLTLVSQGAIDWETYARALKKVNKDFMDPLNAETRTPAETYKNDMAALNEKFAEGTVTAETYWRAQEKYLEDFQKKLDENSKVAETISKGIGNIFEENLFNNFKDGVKGMYASFTDMLRRLAAQIIASNLLKLFGLTPGGAAYGGLASAGNSLGGGRAGGGDVWGSQSYLVGEKGPELFTPRVSGHVYSTEDTMRMKSSQPGKLVVELSDKALDVTMREWLEGELAGLAATR